MINRYRPETLILFAQALFQAEGMGIEQASVTARLLVEADLLGHTTHGLQLASGYLAHLRAGKMRGEGAPIVISDHGAVGCWDGERLPGLWLTSRAVDAAIEKARAHGTGSIAIRRSHHIGCLAAFLEGATAQGMMIIVASSDPAVASVAPYGGRLPLFTPDPIAIGIPTDEGPILIDISASITTNGYSARLAAEGKHGEHAWWLDHEGHATRDSSVVAADPPGSILPVGGVDHGHKGFGLALLIEALTQGLGGYGRADGPTEWGASVFVQALDPDRFAGADAFNRETGWLARACRANPPRPDIEAVRVHGDAALARKAKALEEGVALYPGIMEALGREAERLGVGLPQAMGA